MAGIRPRPPLPAADHRRHARAPVGGPARRRASARTRRWTRSARSWTRASPTPRPRFFGYVGSSGLELGVLADALAASHDINLAASAAAADLVERQTLRWVGDLVGFPAATGTFTSGGMISNLTALTAARERAQPGSRLDGCDGRGVVYASAEAHSSVERAVEVLGLGRRSLRVIAIDSSRRMQPAGARGGRRARRRRRAACRSPSSRPPAPRSREPSTRSGRSPRCAPPTACGCTSTARTGCPPRRRGRPARCSTGSSWPTRPRSTGTSGCSCRRPAASCSCAGAPTSRRRSRTRRPTSPTSSWPSIRSTGRSSTRARSGRSSCGSRCGRTARPPSATRSSTTSRWPGSWPTACGPPTTSSCSSSRRSRSSRSGASPPAGDVDEHNRRLVGELQRDGRLYVTGAVVDGRWCLRPCIVNYRTTESDAHALVDIVREVGRRIETE